MAQLSQSELAGISIACAVVVLTVGLVVTLVLVRRSAAKPAAVAPVVPPVNPDAPIQPVKTQMCSPATAGYKNKVACDSQATCNGCVEFTDVNSQYSCVTVGAGNTTVDMSGQLVHPLVVTYPVPFTTTDACSGHGEVVNGKCECAGGYSGTTCNMITQFLTEPGSYCLPSTVQQCNTPTTDSVLVNEASGKGAQYECQCKPEYAGLFTQAVQGGTCDVPLVCGGNNVETERDGEKARLFHVYTGKNDANEEPIFSLQPVVANRLTAATGSGSVTTQTCVAKMGPITNGCGNWSPDVCKPLETADVAPDADPTCTAPRFSNVCQTSFAVPGTDLGVFMTIRGSDRPGDPVKERVYPAFYPPVPPGLQRCPDGFKGLNTPSSRCTNDKGETLKFKPSTDSACDGSREIDVRSQGAYGSEWYTAAFTDDGEWNGYFTCVQDLATSRVLVNDKEEKVAADMPWRTVIASAAGGAQISEVLCIDNGGQGSGQWLMRSADGSQATQPRSDYCVGATCGGVTGEQAQPWDGFVSGALFDAATNEPWFSTDVLSLGVPEPTYGGQCACDGAVYRRDATGTYVPTPMVPAYMLQNTGSTNWWNCVADTCWSADTPQAKLVQGASANLTHPRCDCGVPPTAGSAPPFETYMSYRPEGQGPVCIRDSCNPGGVRTSSVMTCSPDDDVNKCQGTCMANRCHLKTDVACPGGRDDECSANRINTRVDGKCDTETKMCVYPDLDRLGSHCDKHMDCSYGTCTNVVTMNVKNDKGVIKPIQQGTCSGGCACDIEYVQQLDQSSPLGFTCKKRCDVTPCISRNTTDGKCSVNRADGKQVCNCKSCYTGDRCQSGKNQPMLGEQCIIGATKADMEKPGASAGAKTYLAPCCEGYCQPISGQRNGPKGYCVK